jgi:hypothetical protein
MLKQHRAEYGLDLEFGFRGRHKYPQL